MTDKKEQIKKEEGVSTPKEEEFKQRELNKLFAIKGQLITQLETSRAQLDNVNKQLEKFLYKE